MKGKLITIISILTIFLFLSACTKNSVTDKNMKESTSETKYTFIQKITYKDENSSAIIIKNKLTKSASIDMFYLYNQTEIITNWLNASDMINLSTSFACYTMQLAFFNKTGFDEFQKELTHLVKNLTGQLNELNSKNYTIEDDSPKEQKEEKPQPNPIEGYNVKRFHLEVLDKANKSKLSECTVTGSSNSNIEIKIY